MAMTIFFHGDPLFRDYTPGVAVTAGDVVVINGVPEVAHSDIAANKAGSLATWGGVYKIPCDATIPPMNALVYWDAANKVVTLTSAGNTLFGRVTDDVAGVTTGDLLNVLHLPIQQPPGGGSGVIEKNTAITTVGAGTLLGAALAGGVITRTGPVAAYSDTTDTALLIVAAAPEAQVGDSWEVTIKNTVPFAQTLVGGAGVTLTGQTIIPPNSVGRFLVTISTLTAVAIQGLAIIPMTTPPLTVSTTLTTVGAATITAAGIAGGVTARGGAQAAAAFTDTTDTAVNLQAALPNANIGQSFWWTYQNNTNAPATIAGGAGVTVSGITIVPANTWAAYLVTLTATNTFTIAGFEMGLNVTLPPTQFTTIAAGNGTLAAGNMEGAQDVTLASSGATAMTTRTAAQIIANVPNMQIGDSYKLRVYNTNAGTLTLTGGAGVTITGTATITTAKFRDYYVTMTGAATITMQNLGSGTAD